MGTSTPRALAETAGCGVCYAGVEKGRGFCDVLESATEYCARTDCVPIPGYDWTRYAQRAVEDAAAPPPPNGGTFHNLRAQWDRKLAAPECNPGCEPK